MQLPHILQNRWWLVFASAVGLTVGTSSIVFNSFSVFVKPVTQEFGWSRSDFSFSLTLVGLITVIASPIFGALLDRYSIKRVALPLIAIMAVAIACMSQIGPSLLGVYGLYAVCGLAGPSQAPLLYSKAISLWFDRNLGMALGIATAGLGFGTMLMPLEAQYLLGHFGWRNAYLGLGLTNFIFAFGAVALFIREPNSMQIYSARQVSAATLSGVSLATAIKTWPFWALTTAFTLGGIANGSLVHVVALLTDRGVSPTVAVRVLASSGPAVILGRLLGGYLLDRSNRPLLPSVFVLLPAIGSALLASGLAGAAPTIAVMLCGFGVGVEVDMMGFFVRRYFGQRSFGKILGFMWPGFAIGASLGPLMMARSFDITHSYKMALIANTVGMVIATMLIATLGRYVFTQAPHDNATASTAPSTTMRADAKPQPSPS